MESQPQDDSHVSEPIKSNLRKIDAYISLQEQKRSRLQLFIEKICHLFGSSGFFISFIAFSVCWVGFDFLTKRTMGFYFDAPPFALLQGIITFIGVLIAMAVLTRQNRLAQVEDARAHFELQVNLLAEQKTTKIIELLEELRQDMPSVKNREDKEAEILCATTNPDAVLKAITEMTKT